VTTIPALLLHYDEHALGRALLVTSLYCSVRKVRQDSTTHQLQTHVVAAAQSSNQLLRIDVASSLT
jgi:hypothetical protein